MHHFLRHAAASVAAICIAAASFGTLVTMSQAQVASVTLPALA
jgi:hypothetical protein